VHPALSAAGSEAQPLTELLIVGCTLIGKPPKLLGTLLAKRRHLLDRSHPLCNADELLEGCVHAIPMTLRCNLGFRASLQRQKPIFPQSGRAAAYALPAAFESRHSYRNRGGRAAMLPVRLRCVCSRSYYQPTGRRPPCAACRRPTKHTFPASTKISRCDAQRRSGLCGDRRCAPACRGYPDVPDQAAIRTTWRVSPGVA
jgi:hypothetical protein